jgi:hypothetical protein
MGDGLDVVLDIEASPHFLTALMAQLLPLGEVSE